MSVRLCVGRQNSGSLLYARRPPRPSLTSVSRTPVTSVCWPVSMAARLGSSEAGNSGLRLPRLPWNNGSVFNQNITITDKQFKF